MRNLIPIKDSLRRRAWVRRRKLPAKGSTRLLFRLFSPIHTFAGTALAGAAVLAVLTTNLFDVRITVVAALAGALVGAPVARIVAKRISAA